jgi:hypothetical protein
MDTNKDTYYSRNRERILERSTKAYREEQQRIMEYQRNYFSKAKWREAHREETREKTRQAYAEKVMEEEGRVVVPTIKRSDWYLTRPTALTDTEYRRAKIARRLEINEQRAEQFKKFLSEQNV